jgi:hypothetical protein
LDLRSYIGKQGSLKLQPWAPPSTSSAISSLKITNIRRHKVWEC